MKKRKNITLYFIQESINHFRKYFFIFLIFTRIVNCYYNKFYYGSMYQPHLWIHDFSVIGNVESTKRCSLLIR